MKLFSAFMANYKSISQNKLLLGYLIIAFTFFVVLQVNYNKNHLDRYHPDEFHTVYLTLNSIQSGEISNFRALEGTRWLVRAFYPGALIGMNKKMGGNVKNDSWGYPGHNYISKNYEDSREDLQDPNVRDFFYYLRLQNVLFAFLSLLMLIIYCWKEKHTHAIILLSIFIGINIFFMREKSVVYIETSLFAVTNILVLFYFYILKIKRISFFLVLVASFLSAFILSIKFSSVFFIFILFMLILYKERKNTERIIFHLATYSISFLLFFRIINKYLFSSNESLSKGTHQFFSNFWKYSTGSKTLDQGFYSNFVNMLDVFNASLGLLTYLLPFIFLGGFIYSKKKERLKYGAILAVILLTVFSILAQKEYYDRNFISILGVLLLLVGISIEKIIKGLLNKKAVLLKFKPYLLTITYLLIVIGIIIHHGGVNNFYSTVFPSAKHNIVDKINSLNKSGNKTMVLIDFPEEDLNHKNKIKTLNSFPIVTSDNFVNTIARLKKQISKKDLIVVNRVGNNKQYTNYLLPKMFKHNYQYGNYFVFYNKKQEINVN